ncbi:MAG: heme-binding domain-containing protein [Caldilineaceae bacterium]
MEQPNETDVSEIYANEPRGQLLKRQRRILIWGIVLLIAALIGIQLLPAGLEHNNPPIVQEPPWDSETTRALAVRACYDCHSNETVWPWYSYVAPMSWMILQDVHKGREVLNFSEWTAEQTARLEHEEAVELVSKGLMPLPYYETLHPEANLSTAELGTLINGLIETLTYPTSDALDAGNLDENE